MFSAFSVPVSAFDVSEYEMMLVGRAGTVFRLKGSILHLSFVDLNGSLIPPAAEPWKDTARNDESVAAAVAKDRNSYNR